MCKWKTSCKGYPGKTNIHSCRSALVEFWVVNCGSYPFKPVWVVCGLFGFLTTCYRLLQPVAQFYIIIAVIASNTAGFVSGVS